ncbi:hypothetical protein AGMMS49965_15650 [Bacteroidia bacterium]|nr:hypothetical protein AGMMS49965_15650 [Bacteroidia bacterium]
MSKENVAQKLDSPLCVKAALMNEQNFKKAANIDGIVPNRPGIYCIRITNIEELPEPLKTNLADRKHNIMYIGVASESLNKRLNQELRAKGHGTFFRSIGAVLRYRPVQGSLRNMKNKTNYKFSPPDEQKIINWINQNLVVNWIEWNEWNEWNENITVLETKLIQEHKPLINIANNPSKLPYISDLRKECVRIANEE